MKNPIKMDDLGVLLFLETPISYSSFQIVWLLARPAAIIFSAFHFFQLAMDVLLKNVVGFGGVEHVHRPIQPPYNPYIRGIFGIDVVYSPKGTQHQLLLVESAIFVHHA